MAAAARARAAKPKRTKGQRKAARAWQQAGAEGAHAKTLRRGYKPSPAERAAGRKAAAASEQARAHPQAARKKAARRALTLGAVPCCVAEALAASLRLEGWRVSDADVLALHRLAAGASADGVYVEDVLEAASAYGLAGVPLASYEMLGLVDSLGLDGGQLAGKSGNRCDSGTAVGSREPVPPAAVIFGIDIPGPHAVLDDGSAWWSWGQPWEPFAGALISEAWSVTWSSA